MHENFGSVTYVRSAVRLGNEPDYRSYDAGFRLPLGLELQPASRGGGAAKHEEWTAGTQVSTNDVTHSKEMMESLESTRSSVGLSVDDLDKPSIAERIVGWFRGKK